MTRSGCRLRSRVRGTAPGEPPAYPARPVRIALVGDVHANLPALEAVLEHASERRVSRVWNIGDFVGYGAFPDAVVSRLREVAAVSVIGNYDQKVLAFADNDAEWRRSKRPEKYVAFGWAWRQLSADSRAYLAALPRERRLDVDGLTVLLTHGSPASVHEHLYPDTPEERLFELAEIAAADAVICRHSHRPFVRSVAATTFINTGSVGRPDDGDPRATYALLHVENGEFEVEHHRVAYDVDRAVAAIREHELPEAFAQMMIHGRKLVWVLENL